MVSSAQVKPYEGRAEAFIHPFPQSCSPNCDYQCPGGNIWEKNLQESTGKTLFLWWEKARVCHGVLFPKAAEDVWRCMDHNGSYYHILSPRPMGKTGTHIYCRDGVASFIQATGHHPGFGAHAYPMTWGHLPMERRAARWSFPQLRQESVPYTFPIFMELRKFAWNVLLWYPLAN